MMNRKDNSFKTEQIYQNIMEVLVKEEIQRQLKIYPAQIRSSFNIVEIEAYALNRLPVLYASSEKGRDMQKEIGKQKYRKEIGIAVRRALATVEKNPKRHSKPLVSFSEIESKCREAQSALEMLEDLLIQTQLIDGYPTDLSWDNLVSVVEKALKRLYWKENKKSDSRNFKEEEIDEESSLGWDSSFIS
ncbi:late competence development ComFB family protein [Gloeothece verrucosa]|uniref:Late competence development protein ComFB n=1 Tax=Gloeothece verrucosa (strain PCC 7822) TaxID=497965 RepID=E0UCY2_GLOV7|nr:late competence development ComFB family protein [Gloeothece verrucosa]ADN16447.1 Late competence development protein ComFB [Gloeothece verrucosa PCC 7822]